MEEGYESFKIGALIHDSILEKGLTQEQLAEKVGYLLNCKYQSQQFTEQSKNGLLSHFGKAPPISGKCSTKEWGSNFPKKLNSSLFQYSWKHVFLLTPRTFFCGLCYNSKGSLKNHFPE